MTTLAYQLISAFRSLVARTTNAKKVGNFPFLCLVQVTRIYIAAEEDARVKLTEKLSEVFEELANYVEMANTERVKIAEMKKVLDLFQGTRQAEGCSSERKVIRHNVEGGVLSVVYGCSKHRFCVSARIILNRILSKHLLIQTQLLTGFFYLNRPLILILSEFLGLGCIFLSYHCCCSDCRRH